MFCGYKPSAPENIEDIRPKCDKRNLTYCIMNLTPKMTKESIHQQIDFAFKVYKKHLALKFIKVESNEPCDIKISFWEQDHGDGFPFHGVGVCYLMDYIQVQELVEIYILMLKRIV